MTEWELKLAQFEAKKKPPRLCEIVGCDGKHYGRGLCSMHYHRWKRTAESHESGYRMDLSEFMQQQIYECPICGRTGRHYHSFE